jgi:regulator of protease activity HflC (stomatin/prohibitin superfamily)
MMDSEEIENKKLAIKIFKWVICIVLVLIIIFSVITPLAKPWWATQTGKAELAQAEQNRQIIVIQAIADKDAEITRAEGVAKANEIIGQSLKGNEDYLRYLYITGVTSNSNNREVIYIPTEAGLPILEAGRLNEVKYEK